MPRAQAGARAPGRSARYKTRRLRASWGWPGRWRSPSFRWARGGRAGMSAWSWARDRRS